MSETLNEESLQDSSILDEAWSPPVHHKFTPNIEQVRSYLHRKCRVSISDGRQFIGHFVCVDKEKNMILSATEEYNQGVRPFLVLCLPRAGMTYDLPLLSQRQAR